MEAHGCLWKLMEALITIWNPMEVIKNSKETFVRLQQLIWNGGTDRQTDTQTDTHTDRRTRFFFHP